MRYIRDNICTGYIRARIYISITPGKQDTKCLIKKLINKSAYMNAEIKRGRGGGEVFSPHKDLGTRKYKFKSLNFLIYIFSVHRTRTFTHKSYSYTPLTGLYKLHSTNDLTMVSKEKHI